MSSETPKEAIQRKTRLAIGDASLAINELSTLLESSDAMPIAKASMRDLYTMRRRLDAIIWAIEDSKEAA